MHGCEEGLSRAAAVPDRRTTPWPAAAGWTSALGLVCVVTAITFATRAHELPLTPFLASGTKVASGQVWLLLTSALIVDRPVLIGLAAFVILAAATVRICGARTFWLAGAIGHVASTLMAYAIIGSAQLADPGAFASAVARPDFGVSAMQGAWVGAITATLWARAGSDRRDRSLVLAGVCGLACVAWWLHPDPSVLTTEHLFAFLIGCGIASRRSLVALARTAANRGLAPTGVEPSTPR